MHIEHVSNRSHVSINGMPNAQQQQQQQLKEEKKFPSIVHCSRARFIQMSLLFFIHHALYRTRAK